MSTNGWYHNISNIGIMIAVVGGRGMPGPRGRVRGSAGGGGGIIVV